MYVGRVWLKYTEAEIWALTPRQFDAQLRIHRDLMISKKSDVAPTGFIDQIPGW